MPKHAPLLNAMCELLKHDGILVYPTETFFALGCNAFSATGIERIYALKQRKHSMPLPLIIGHEDMLPLVAQQLCSTAQQLMRLFWPGPLSILLPAQATVPASICGGTEHVAVRLPAHPVAAELSRRSGLVLIATSANISGTPPTAKSHQLETNLLHGVDAFLDAAPQPKGGLPSTLLRIHTTSKQEYIEILREGAIATSQLTQAGFLLWPSKNGAAHKGLS